MPAPNRFELVVQPLKYLSDLDTGVLFVGTSNMPEPWVADDVDFDLGRWHLMSYYLCAAPQHETRPERRAMPWHLLADMTRPQWAQTCNGAPAGLLGTPRMPHGKHLMPFRQSGSSTPLLVLAAVQVAMDSITVELHGDEGCASGKIAGVASLSGSTASAGVATVTVKHHFLGCGGATLARLMHAGNMFVLADTTLVIAFASHAFPTQPGYVRAFCSAVPLATVTWAEQEVLHLAAGAQEKPAGLFVQDTFGSTSFIAGLLSAVRDHQGWKRRNQTALKTHKSALSDRYSQRSHQIFYEFFQKE